VIHVPVILALKIATTVYRNRKLIAQGIQAIRTNQRANEEDNQAAETADFHLPTFRAEWIAPLGFDSEHQQSSHS
jgi:hypothetical protein